MVLVIRTIGLARATVKIGLANLTYNMKLAVRGTRSAALISSDPGPSQPHEQLRHHRPAGKHST